MTPRNKKQKFLGYSPKTRIFLQNIVSEFLIDDSAGIKLLEVAGGALDRLYQAQDILKREGVTIADRHGNSKLHPACTIEKDSRAHFLQALKAMNLALEPLKNIGRPGGK